MKVTAERIRSMVADCKTEADVIRSLRSHRVKYYFTTETGYMSIKIPCRKGAVRIYRTCSHSAPLRMTSSSPLPYTVPVFSPYY